MHRYRHILHAAWGIALIQITLSCSQKLCLGSAGAAQQVCDSAACVPILNTVCDATLEKALTDFSLPLASTACVSPAIAAIMELTM